MPCARALWPGPEEHTYVLDLELYGAINKEDTKISQTDRTILLVIAKKEEGFWPRLLSAAGKTAPNIKAGSWGRGERASPRCRLQKGRRRCRALVYSASRASRDV